MKPIPRRSFLRGSMTAGLSLGMPRLMLGAGLRSGGPNDAVNVAWSLAKPGEVVLFSPGTSSFDMFKSYADRGNQFRALVQALRSANDA